MNRTPVLDQAADITIVANAIKHLHPQIVSIGTELGLVDVVIHVDDYQSLLVIADSFNLDVRATNPERRYGNSHAYGTIRGLAVNVFCGTPHLVPRVYDTVPYALTEAAMAVTS